MVLGFIWITLKHLLILVVPVLTYYIYLFIVAQWLSRRHFKRFPNVYVTEKFVPLFGDAKKFKEDLSNNRAKHYHQIEYALSLKGYDFRAFIVGNVSILYLISQKSFTEFMSRTPEYLDRMDMSDKSFGKICPHALLFAETTSNWKNRRDSFMRHMSLNNASQYIQVMIDACEEVITTWKDNSEYDMLNEFNKITFIVITVILFGKDVNQKIGSIEYLKNDGTIVLMPFNEYFIIVCKDLMATSMNLTRFLMPILAKYDAIKPYTTNKTNVNTLHQKLREYLNNNKDENSVYYKLTEIEKLDKDQIFSDLIGFLFAGHETSSHAATSALYFLAKNDETKVKLLDELKTFKGISTTELKDKLNKNSLNEMEYLYMVIKETLRIDPPANETLPYKCVKDFNLCGVPIKKGQILAPNLLSMQLNPSEWRDPLKFIPERFDPESEYYLTPDSKKRHSLSYLPFSIGIRNCPGQVLALLETKVLLVYFLSKVDYTIDKEILENPYAYFAVISQLKCKFVPRKY